MKELAAEADQETMTPPAKRARLVPGENFIDLASPPEEPPNASQRPSSANVSQSQIHSAELTGPLPPLFPYVQA